MKAYGENHSETLFALGRICIIKRILKKFDEAESAIQRAVSGAEQCSPNDRLYPWLLENLAFLREAEGRAQEAVSVFETVIRESERIHGFPSEGTVEHLYHQSGCLLRMEHVDLAEQAIRRAIAVLDQVESLRDCEKSDYFATLASILEATDRKAEAAEMQAQADELLRRPADERED
jgi:tetratricopeptide (TPR) repeat protein